jgi:hypothetical protein
MKSVLAFLVAFVLLATTAFAAVPDDLQGVSVTIKAANSQGSGSIVTRQIGDDTVSFVWTAAHVVDGLRTTRSVIVNGNTKILVEYKDAEIVQELQQDGRRIGEVKYEAKVIKVSDADYGEDLALLMVRRKNAYPLSISTKFKTDKNYIPAIGTKLVHVGSLLGQFGANSFTNGLISQTGRTLAGKGANVKVFDQTTVTAFPGSSGGGVFLEDTGDYVGMLTQGVQKLQGFNFIVPVRRIHEWATASNIEWAIDPNVPMPSLKGIESIPVEDAGVIGSSFGEPTPAPSDEPCDFNKVIDWLKPFFQFD